VALAADGFGRPFSRRTHLQMLNTTNDARASDHDR